MEEGRLVSRNPAKSTNLETSDATDDGRRKRSARSRERIVDAMFEVILSGDMHPSASRIAEAANVSLRTVFRHFEEMDSLYGEMTERMEAEIMPQVTEPFTAPDWRAKLEELVERRARIYERIMPLKVAGSLRRFQSPLLAENYRRFLEGERAGLRLVLPAEIAVDPVRFAALETATGFQAWRRMRQDQGLSPEDAKAAMRFTVFALADAPHGARKG